MISSEHRALALDVAAGKDVGYSDEPGHLKAVKYGLVAQVLSELMLPTPQDVLHDRDPHSVDTVMHMLNKQLKKLCDNVLAGDPELEKMLSSVTNRRWAMAGGTTLANAAQYTLHGGVNTAMDVEGATHATILSRLQSGQQITKGGLMQSQRVPFGFAVLPVSVINATRFNPDVYELTDLEDVRMSGCTTLQKIFKPEIVAMTPDHGLVLTDGFPHRTAAATYAGEPTIGCPATLVKNFVRDVHTLAAETCVQAGIIQITD